MMRVGIISLFHNSQNYGGTLQAFALNRVFEMLGIEAYQIDYTPTPKNMRSTDAELIKRYFTEHTFAECFNKVFKSLDKKIYSTFHRKKMREIVHLRAAAFNKFREEQIRHTKLYDPKTISEICDEFDVYICGSDQIWKPSVVDDAYMLSFVAKNIPKFSYAASVSVNQITNEDAQKYSNWLREFSGISVRESQAQELLQPLCQQQVHWVCDPVLLLTKEQWIECTPIEHFDEPYIFCYFLGDDIIFRGQAQKFAQKKGLKIITFPDLLQNPRRVDENFGDIKLYNATPFDFVNLIANAQYVLTDSFHATALSLNFSTPFFVFERSAISTMHSRITSILQMTGCENRFCTNPETFHSILTTLNTDWKYVANCLAQQREKSFEYILSQLQGGL